MTYSHKFDPNKELCRYELAGGFCNDPECDLQHFRNVGLSGAWVVYSQQNLSSISSIYLRTLANLYLQTMTF